MATIADWRYGTTESEMAARKKSRIATGLEEELKVPEYDTGRIAGLTQEQMSPALGSLRRQMQRVQARRYASPLARREAIRGGIRGFGEALPAIQAGAQRTAMGLYQPEYQREVAEYNRLERERQLEEARQEASAIRRSMPISGGETYRQAVAGMPSIFDSGGGPLRIAAQPTTGLTQATPTQQYPEDWMS